MTTYFTTVSESRATMNL